MVSNDGPSPRSVLLIQLSLLGVAVVAVWQVTGVNPVFLAAPSLLFEWIAGRWTEFDRLRRRLVLVGAGLAVVAYLAVLRLQAAYGIGVAVGYAILSDPLLVEALLGAVGRRESSTTGGDDTDDAVAPPESTADGSEASHDGDSPTIERDSSGASSAPRDRVANAGIGDSESREPVTGGDGSPETEVYTPKRPHQQPRRIVRTGTACPDCGSDLQRVLFETDCPYCGYRVADE